MVMELSPRTLVFPILLLSLGFLALLTTSVLAFFEFLPLTTILGLAIGSVLAMVAGVLSALLHTFFSISYPHSRRPH